MSDSSSNGLIPSLELKDSSPNLDMAQTLFLLHESKSPMHHGQLPSVDTSTPQHRRNVGQFSSPTSSPFVGKSPSNAGSSFQGHLLSYTDAVPSTPNMSVSVNQHSGFGSPRLAQLDAQLRNPNVNQHPRTGITPQGTRQPPKRKLGEQHEPPQRQQPPQPRSFPQQPSANYDQQQPHNYDLPEQFQHPPLLQNSSPRAQPFFSNNANLRVNTFQSPGALVSNVVGSPSFGYRKLASDSVQIDYHPLSTFGRSEEHSCGASSSQSSVRNVVSRCIPDLNPSSMVPIEVVLEIAENVRQLWQTDVAKLQAQLERRNLALQQVRHQLEHSVTQCATGVRIGQNTQIPVTPISSSSMFPNKQEPPGGDTDAKAKRRRGELSPHLRGLSYLDEQCEADSQQPNNPTTKANWLSSPLSPTFSVPNPVHELKSDMDDVAFVSSSKLHDRKSLHEFLGIDHLSNAIPPAMFERTHEPQQPRPPPENEGSPTKPRSAPTELRKGVRWTPEEDNALREAAGLFKEQNWKSIAERVPGRNHVQCIQRWQKVLKPGLVKGSWSTKEDAVLVNLAHKHEKKNWSMIAQHIPGRTAKQCRERWSLNLDPSINRGPWTPQEDQLLLELHKNYGNRWACIKRELEGRTENAVKTRYKSLSRTKKRRVNRILES